MKWNSNHFLRYISPVDLNPRLCYFAVVVVDMEEKLIHRLESAVCRLEALSSGFSTGGVSSEIDGNAASEPPILAFDDLMRNYVRKVSDAAEKIGGQVLEATRILEEAFSVEKELLVKIKQTQVIGSLLFYVFFFFLNEDLMNSLMMRIPYFLVAVKFESSHTLYKIYELLDLILSTFDLILSTLERWRNFTVFIRYMDYSTHSQ